MKKKILLNSIFIYSIIITILYINTSNNLKETDNKLKESKEKYNSIAITETSPTTYTFMHK